jgi:hypothetical protein
MSRRSRVVSTVVVLPWKATMPGSSDCDTRLLCPPPPPPKNTQPHHTHAQAHMSTQFHTTVQRTPDGSIPSKAHTHVHTSGTANREGEGRRRHAHTRWQQLRHDTRPHAAAHLLPNGHKIVFRGGVAQLGQHRLLGELAGAAAVVGERQHTHTSPHVQVNTERPGQGAPARGSSRRRAFGPRRP